MCEHNCVNIDGGYNCTCESEHALATDFYNCLGKLNLRLLIAIQLFGILNYKLEKDPCRTCPLLGMTV